MGSSDLTRKDLLKWGAVAGLGAAIPWSLGKSSALVERASAVTLAAGLSDPATQPKFAEIAPNALDPGFKYMPGVGGGYTVGVGVGATNTGLLTPAGTVTSTPIFGYGDGGGYTWPGKTFEIQSGAGTTEVTWLNNLGNQHLLPVDTSLHWAYGADGYTIAANGVPMVPHLHGGHTDYQFDGNPEFWWSPGQILRGPQWADTPTGFTNTFVYDNDVPAGNLWYHDHALGITRLNVYAGMAGFYIVRDAEDTGLANNPLGLPAFPYELAYAIQDRMFTRTGDLFYPAFPGEPFYADFITTPLPVAKFPGSSQLPGTPQVGGGPTALAEFFGDHMLVNGKIWPKADVEPRHYRMRLLNGCDSRFMVIRFRKARRPDSTDLRGAGAPMPFWVIGSDQGLAAKATEVKELLIGPGERYDVVFDFTQVRQGDRVIIDNIASDAPFGGSARGNRQNFFPDRQTDRIMAFDVTVPLDTNIPDQFDPTAIAGPPVSPSAATNTRQVALYEGTDEYQRLQPLLGTTVGGSIAWASPTTEAPVLNSTEIWEIYNTTGDAHPVHLHLVNFEILDRQKFRADLIPQPVVQHNGEVGSGFRMENIRNVGRPTAASGVEKAPKDMVNALPGEVTRIKATFDKPGRYVWHCHILSHEDHEMMRVLLVVEP